jgi:hypothetical protein
MGQKRFQALFTQRPTFFRAALRAAAICAKIPRGVGISILPLLCNRMHSEIRIAFGINP